MTSNNTANPDLETLRANLAIAIANDDDNAVEDAFDDFARVVDVDRDASKAAYASAYAAYDRYIAVVDART